MGDGQNNSSSLAYSEVGMCGKEVYFFEKEAWFCSECNFSQLGFRILARIHHCQPASKCSPATWPSRGNWDAMGRGGQTRAMLKSSLCKTRVPSLQTSV